MAKFEYSRKSVLSNPSWNCFCGVFLLPNETQLRNRLGQATNFNGVQKLYLMKNWRIFKIDIRKRKPRVTCNFILPPLPPPKKTTTLHLYIISGQGFANHLPGPHLGQTMNSWLSEPRQRTNPEIAGQLEPMNQPHIINNR